MFEQYAGILWGVLFFALILYGVSNAISVPLRVKSFYKRLEFTDIGENLFEKNPYSESLLLKGLKTKNHYRGEYVGQSIEQFAAVAVNRRQFTLNKIIRKRNQQISTITTIPIDGGIAEFCARPMRVPEAPEYVLNNDAVQFPDDRLFASSVHVVAEDHLAARKLLNSEVREFLNGIDPLSLESVQGLLILKRQRQPHDTGKQLEEDLDALTSIANSLLAQYSEKVSQPG